MKKSAATVLAGVFMAFTVHAPAAQAGFLEDLIFAPRPNEGPVPQTYGTPYYCPDFKAAGNGSGWKGYVAGINMIFDKSEQISRVGCFTSKAECQAFVTYMSGYLEYIRYARCEAF